LAFSSGIISFLKSRSLRTRISPEHERGIQRALASCTHARSSQREKGEGGRTGGYGRAFRRENRFWVNNLGGERALWLQYKIITLGVCLPERKKEKLTCSASQLKVKFKFLT
jgi:hypothetical protein